MTSAGGVPRLRSALFVPGYRRDFLAKLERSATDAVILDLEDAVPADQKAHARDEVKRWLGTRRAGQRPVACVRINPLADDCLAADLAAAVSPAVCALLLPKLEEHGPFDAVFIDADKGSYDKYGEWAAKNTRAGGLLIGDNAHYFGKLLDLKDDSAAAMRQFHEDATHHYDTVCIPTPDGMLLGVRR